MRATVATYFSNIVYLCLGLNQLHLTSFFTNSGRINYRYSTVFIYDAFLGKKMCQALVYYICWLVGVQGGGSPGWAAPGARGGSNQNPIQRRPSGEVQLQPPYAYRWVCIRFMKIYLTWGPSTWALASSCPFYSVSFSSMHHWFSTDIGVILILQRKELGSDTTAQYLNNRSHGQTSGQPQVKLSLWRSISLKIQS